MKRSFNDDEEYSSEDESSFMFKPVQKKMKLSSTIKTNHNFNENEYKLPYDKPISIISNYDILISKFDKSKIKLSKIMDVEDNIIEIEEIQKKHDEIPRADGFTFKDPDFLSKNLPERYNREWLKNLTDRQHNLQKDPSYHFLSLLAGKINTDITTVINTNDLDEILDYNKRLLRDLEKERNRLIVSTKDKKDQITYLEEILEKDKIDYEDFHSIFIRYSNILNEGNGLIETGKNKDIPKQLYGQGILYILKIEEEFSPCQIIYKVFKSTSIAKRHERTSQVFLNEISKIQINTQKIGKEIFKTKNFYKYDGIKDLGKDRQHHEFIHYLFLLIFKYYFSQNYNFDDIYLPPKEMVQQRFKYLINYNKDLPNNKENILNLGEKLKEPLNGKDKNTFLLKHKELLKKYNFSIQNEEDAFNALLTGSVKLFDLIFTDNIVDNYIIYYDLLKIYYYFPWEQLYHTETINFKHFIRILCPQSENGNKIIIGKPPIDQFKDDQQLIFKLIDYLATEGSKLFFKNKKEDQQDFNVLNNWNYLYEKLPHIYDLVNRQTSDKDEKYPLIIFQSYFVYYYLNNTDYPIQNLIDIIKGDKFNGLELDSKLEQFLSFYDFEATDTNYILLPFLVDKVTIKYMKEFYFITMNQYLYDIIKILYDDKIIQFSDEISKLIESHNNDYQINDEKGDEQEQHEISDDELKINASFYKIVNELSKKSTLFNIIDKSFENFLKSLEEKNLNQNKIKCVQKGKKNCDNNIIISKLPTKSLNINNQFNNESYPIINIHLYFYLYVEFLKEKSNKINRLITKTKKGIYESKNIISNITQEKIDMTKIENKLKENYTHPLSWILDPINSGVLRVKDSVSAAIADSLNELNKTNELSDLTLPVIILSPKNIGLTIQFCVLVSYVYQKQENRSNTQYYKNIQITGNFTDISKQIFEIKNTYTFKKPSNTFYDKSFLGIINYKNQNIKIYDHTIKKKSKTTLNIASF